VLGENIQLTFAPARDLPGVLGDSGMLDQVVMNLMINARDAMPQGGRLVLTTALMKIDAAHARRHAEARPGKFVCLSVSDTGCGMDAATLNHIFEPFFTTKGVGRGTGLGLATAYGIVKQHQGWIEVSSQVGHGTTFFIFLPGTQWKAPAKAVANPGAASRRGGETILVVEDEPNLRELARILLQSYGYRILEASSGLEALEFWTKQKDQIDLLLTDLVMPDGMTGLELGRKLVSEKASLKIVYTSGYSSELLRSEVRPESICFLQKPYAAQTMVETIRRMLDRSTTTERYSSCASMSHEPGSVTPPVPTTAVPAECC